MATQRAIILQGEKKVALVTDRPIPKLRSGYVLVEVKAVALNPTDWKHKYYLNTPGSLLGCDYAGVVAEVGTGYTKHWKKGDRICGFVHGGNKLQLEDGAFAEKIVVKADIQFKIPDSMSFEDASTLGVALVTVGQGFYQVMSLNSPTEPALSGEPILIYGGSSAMGTMGIQFAKLYTFWGQPRGRANND
jgi:NADPH:quinone reductase-like Zn-dependent oxidoreductase